MYNIQEKDGYCVYTFNGIDLKIKSVENKDNCFIYINYNGYNPLMTMLFGDFESECEIDSIGFEVRRENGVNDHTMYAVVNKDDLIGFVKEIYFFVMENKKVLDKVLSYNDRNIRTF